MNDKKTVGDCLRTYDALQDTAAKVSALGYAVQADPDLHDLLQKKAGGHMPDQKPKDPTYVLNAANNYLQEYATILKKAIDRTEIDWPPRL